MSAQPPDGSAPDSQSGAQPPAAEGPGATFDPYRFGPPAHPIDPAYAPPGYVPPPAPEPPAPPVPGGQQFPGAFGTYPPAGSPGSYPQPGYPPSGYPTAGGYPPAPGYPPSGYSPYGQQPYGYVPPYPYGTNARNGMAVTALVLGIVSLVLCWTAFFDAVLIILAIIFAIIGISTASKRGGIGKTMAIIGLCLSLVASIGANAFSVLYLSKCHTTDDGLGHTSTHCSFSDNNN